MVMDRITYCSCERLTSSMPIRCSGVIGFNMEERRTPTEYALPWVIFPAIASRLTVIDPFPYRSGCGVCRPKVFNPRTSHRRCLLSLLPRSFGKLASSHRYPKRTRLGLGTHRVYYGLWLVAIKIHRHHGALPGLAGHPCGSVPRLPVRSIAERQHNSASDCAFHYPKQCAQMSKWRSQRPQCLHVIAFRKRSAPRAEVWSPMKRDRQRAILIQTVMSRSGSVAALEAAISRLLACPR